MSAQCLSIEATQQLYGPRLRTQQPLMWTMNTASLPGTLTCLLIQVRGGGVGRQGGREGVCESADLEVLCFSKEGKGGSRGWRMRLPA